MGYFNTVNIFLIGLALENWKTQNASYIKAKRTDKMRGFIKIFEPYNMVIDALNDSLWVADAINMEKSNNEDLYTHSINVAV